MSRIFESRMVTTGSVPRRLSKMVGSLKPRNTLEEWVRQIGPSNTQLAISNGVLTEVITESSLVSMNGVLKNGDYVVYHGEDGYTMYHMSDDQLWKTTGESLEDLTDERVEAAEGISLSDGDKRVVMSGHETPPVPPSPGVPQQIEVEPEELPELDIEMPPMATEPELAPEEPLMAPPAVEGPEMAMSPFESMVHFGTLVEDARCCAYPHILNTKIIDKKSGITESVAPRAGLRMVMGNPERYELRGICGGCRRPMSISD